MTLSFLSVNSIRKGTQHMKKIERKFTLSKEEELCQLSDAFLTRMFGPEVSLENIVRRTCIVFVGGEESSEILSTKVRGLNIFKKKETFRASLGLVTGSEIQLAVAKTLDIPMSPFIDIGDMLEYSVAEHEGWVGGVMTPNPNKQNENKRTYFPFLIPNTIQVKLPFNVKVKIL